MAFATRNFLVQRDVTTPDAVHLRQYAGKPLRGKALIRDAPK
jgi:hypothetical protein